MADVFPAGPKSRRIFSDLPIFEPVAEKPNALFCCSPRPHCSGSPRRRREREKWATRNAETGFWPDAWPAQPAAPRAFGPFAPAVMTNALERRKPILFNLLRCPAWPRSPHQPPVPPSRPAPPYIGPPVRRAKNVRKGLLRSLGAFLPPRPTFSQGCQPPGFFFSA